MAVNQIKKAQQQQNARARARQRREQRQQEFGLHYLPARPDRDDLSPGLAALAARSPFATTNAVPLGVEKLSAVVLEFLEPYTSGLNSDEQHRAVTTLGIMAWNLPMLDARERERIIRPALAKLPQFAHRMFEDMVRRRVSDFMDDPRIVVDFEITSTQSGLSLSVAYGLRPQERPGSSGN